MTGRDDREKGIEPDVDLTGVSPLRREETLRRARAAIEWLACPNRDAASEAEAAARLGTGVTSFRAIVAAWSRHGRANMLPGARVPTTRPRRLRPATSREAETIVADVIRDLGQGARRKAAFEETFRRCRTAGITPPSESTVAARLYRARSRNGGEGSCGQLVVDHCAVRLPVLHEGTLRAPVATIVFKPDGWILAHALRIGGPSPQPTAEVLAALLRVPPDAGDVAGLVLNRDHTPGWNGLVDLLSDAGVGLAGGSGTPVPSSRRLRARFGAAIGDIALMPRFTHSDDEPAYFARYRSPPLSIQDATAAFDAAVRSENAKHHRTGNRPRLSSPQLEHPLAAALDAFAAMPPERPRRRPARS